MMPTLASPRIILSATPVSFSCGTVSLSASRALRNTSQISGMSEALIPCATPLWRCTHYHGGCLFPSCLWPIMEPHSCPRVPQVRPNSVQGVLMFKRSSALLVLVVLSSTLTAQEQPYPAHKVVGNVYYVGSEALATYLITTPEGHILINSGFEETVPLIRSSVESLGFKMRDIKVLLASHAHSDHVAGHALARELTGAKVDVMRGDDRVIASGGEGQYF